MTDIDNDIDGMEELDLDTSLGEVKEDLYYCEIKGAAIKKGKESGKNSIRVSLEVCDGPYAGTRATDIIGLDMSKGFNAKKVKNFLESILGEKLGQNIKLPLTRDAQDQVQVDVVGERVGAYLKTDDESGFVNVTMKGYTTYNPNATDGDDKPF